MNCRLLSIMVLFSLCLLSINPLYGAGLLRVTYLDVGQGDSILMRMPDGKNILIDAGDDRGNSAENVIIPYLKKNGIKQIDTAIISHAHRDHLGGYLSLLRKFPVKEVIETQPATTQMYKEILKIISEKGIILTKGYKGDKPDWDSNCKIEILHPPKLWTTKDEKLLKTNLDVSIDSPLGSNLNNFSIVFTVKYGNITYFFAGDAEEGAEEEMIHSNSSSKFKTTIYKASHHGSKTSSSPLFLSKIKPETTVISVGEGNQFKHPHDITLKNLKHYSKKIYRTDEDGTIETWTDGKTIHYSYSGSPNAMVQQPSVKFLSHDTVTLNWSTSRPSSTTLHIGSEKYFIDEMVQDHFITVSGLTPETTYNFTVDSKTFKINDDLSSTGEFTTLAKPSISGNISSIVLNPTTVYMNEELLVQVKATGGDTLKLYSKAVDDRFLIGKITLHNGTGRIKWFPKVDKIKSIFVELKKGNRSLTVKSKNINLKRRLVLIDEGHENYGKGQFETMCLNLYYEGFETKTFKSKITATLLKNASVLVLPETMNKKKYLSTEITAMKKFVENGKSILFISRADYKGYSNPQNLNAVLEKIGSNLRFNDDEVLDKENCSGTAEWILIPEDFSKKIISKDVKYIMAPTSCSILDGNYKPVNSSSKIISIAKTSKSGVNIDADNTGDAVIYPVGNGVTIDAAEILPSGGKIALFGSFHVFSRAYQFSSNNQTSLYNRDVLRWLAVTEKLKMGELAKRLTENFDKNSGDEEISESRIIRHADIKKAIEDRFEKLPIPEAIPAMIEILNNSQEDELENVASALKEIIDRIRYESVRNDELYSKIRKDLNKLTEIYYKIR